MQSVPFLLALPLSCLVLSGAEPSPLLDDPLTAESEGWTSAKGDWKRSEDGATGTEKAEDKHAAVMRRPVAFDDAVFTFSFRLESAKAISFSINDAKGHVCRLMINEAGFVAKKDDHDHEGPDKAVTFNRIDKPIKSGEWHEAKVEIKGAEMTATIDGETSKGSDTLIDGPKSNVGFTVTGGTASFKNLKATGTAPGGK